MNSAEKKIFSNSVPVTRPWFSEEEEDLLIKALHSGWVTQGPAVKQFEQETAAYVGAAHAVEGVEPVVAAGPLIARDDVVFDRQVRLPAAGELVAGVEVQEIGRDVEPLRIGLGSGAKVAELPNRPIKKPCASVNTRMWPAMPAITKPSPRLTAPISKGTIKP